VLTYAQKRQAVEALRERFDKAGTIIVADYRGLDVPSVNTLRSQLRSEGEGQYEYLVVKNSVLKRAAAGGEVELLAEHFQGPTAVALSYSDPVGLAKVLVRYAKDNEAFEIKGGLMDGRVVGLDEIGTLATLPGLDELRGTIVGLLQAPAQKIAAVLQAPALQLARVMDARRAQLEESGGA